MTVFGWSGRKELQRQMQKQMRGFFLFDKLRVRMTNKRERRCRGISLSLEGAVTFI
jgi:hypothetical protein